MYKNYLLKILFSLPIILLIFYFIPFIGICMLIARKFILGKSKYNLGIALIIITVIILIPKMLSFITNLFKTNIDFINQILESDIYLVLINRCKILFIIGIILLIINAITNKIKNSALNGLMSYINNIEEQDRKINEKNELIMREKQMNAKNTHFVHCPHCGADNHFSGNLGKCRYCKRTLEYKK